MILEKEDIEFIQHAYELINKHYFPNTKKITEVYNRVFADKKNFAPKSQTNCGTCLRSRVLEMKAALDKVLKEMENQNANNDENKDENKNEN